MLKRIIRKTRGKVAVAGIATAAVVSGHYVGFTPDAYVEPTSVIDQISYDDANQSEYIDFAQNSVDVDKPSFGITGVTTEAIGSTDNFDFTKIGTASYYADKFHGRMTANGETYNMYDYTAAHKTLPFGSVVRVTNTKTNKSVLLKINDRGPYVGDRIIDLSVTGAKEIGSLGLSTVKIETVHKGKLNKAGVDKGTLVGYSLDKDFIMVDQDEIEVLESTTSFGHAFRLYKDYIEINPGEDLYIFNDTSIKGHSKLDTYYIGKIDKVQDDYAQLGT
jgi:rare lipoprotein A